MFPDADKTYSMVWSPSNERTTMVPYYLGPAVQELFYRIVGAGPVGPRISSVIGAVLASAAVFAWLLLVGVTRWVALACALLVFWDPLFVESYRGARVDSWSIAFIILGLCVIAKGQETQRTSFGVAWWHVLGGICIGVAGLLWPSAIILIPLVIYQCLRQDPRRVRQSVSIRASDLFSLGCFSLIAVFILLAPVLRDIHQMTNDSSGMAGDRLTDRLRFLGLVGPYVRSPWVALCALGALAYCRMWGLGLATLAAIAFVLVTGAYVHRSVYLLPYFVACIAFGYSKIVSERPTSRNVQAAALSVLVFMLLWSGAVSVGARTIVALKEKSLRDPEQLREMLSISVGPGPHAAYLIDYDNYYAARSLGWKTHKALHPEDWSQSDVLRILTKVDIVVVRADNPFGPPPELMHTLGFQLRLASTGNGAAKRRENYGEYILYER